MGIRQTSKGLGFMFRRADVGIRQTSKGLGFRFRRADVGIGQTSKGLMIGGIRHAQQNMFVVLSKKSLTAMSCMRQHSSRHLHWQP